MAAASLRLGLSAATPIYRGMVAVRNGLFKFGIRSAHRVGSPVISVGNITTGGTGKTPIVGWLARWLKSHDHHPCLLSRGYRAQNASGNDEYQVLQQLAPQVPHLQNRDRVAAAREAITRFASDVLILDDGFQHRRLHRDLDIVLVDGLQPWGFGRLLPRGLLREPRNSLARANLVIVTRVSELEPPSRTRLLQEIGKFTSAPIAEAAFRPQHLRDVCGSVSPLDSLTRQRVFGFCGIGNPDGFRSTLDEAGFSVVGLEAFPDHHHYSQSDLVTLVSLAQQSDAAALVTTQKDLVKLEPDWGAEFPLWAVAQGVEFLTGQQVLQEMVLEAIAETSARRSG